MKLPKKTIIYHTLTSNFFLHTVPFHFPHSILIILVPPILPSHSSLDFHSKAKFIVYLETLLSWANPINNIFFLPHPRG